MTPPTGKVTTAAEAVADIEDGASIGIAGFGLSHRYPSTLISALGDKGSRGLTVYCNGLGQPGFPTGTLLADNHQIGHLVTCFSARPGVVTEAEKQIAAGDMTLEMVPQGTLVERMRAGGAGLAAIYTPTGYGSRIADGKDIRYFDGRPYVLERAITTDFAFIRAAKADHFGNVAFRGGSQNFNVSFAKAAKVTIVEAEEIVPTGEIAPHEVDLPGVFVTRVVPITVAMDVHNLPKRANRPASSAKQYLGKSALTRAEIGRRAAALLPDNAVVNLGAGLPVQVANWVTDRPVVLHAENGLLNYGGFAGDDFDPDLHDAGGQFVTTRPGTSFFDSVTSFEIARGGRLYAVILGTYQVGGNGDLANWSAPGMIGGGVGGAMDLAAGAQHVFVTLEHTDSKGLPKLVERCEFPLTMPNCVDAIVTDLALLRRPDRNSRFTLEEIAAGFTVDEVLSLTGMAVDVADEVGVMQENWL
ncbi:MAG TPA: 3-oxoacid CoA-transferase [Trebonia sp.]|jgi:3-oxoacid CoA-transferase|nr:3-oxoacid CoA-transferase [Trebonia sp.]